MGGWQQEKRTGCQKKHRKIGASKVPNLKFFKILEGGQKHNWFGGLQYVLVHKKKTSFNER